MCFRSFYIFTGLLSAVIGIKLENGAYKDVYIVIKDSVAENAALIENIKAIFTNASQLLYEVTNHRVYFGEIKIIIPAEWTTKDGFKRSPTISTLEPHVSVETSDITIPRVVGLDICGKGGKAMVLSPEFLMKPGYTEHGSHAHVIVHEWGHLRWGLFDEYPSRKKKSASGTYYTQFYQDKGEWRPVSCPEGLKGAIGVGETCIDDTSRMCSIFDTTSVIDSSCHFCIDSDEEKSNSIMSNTKTKKVHFCDDSTSVEEHMLHNKKADNMQNTRCGLKSAWDVMRDHADFKGDINLPKMETFDTKPVFSIVQETVPFKVFVLDVSGSMEGENIDTLHQAASYIIQNFLQIHSHVAIVTFESHAEIKKDLTEIKSETDINSLVASLPTDALGGTCMGCGIEKAIELLRKDLGDKPEGDIILLSDGENNEGNLEAAVQMAKEAKVSIQTVSVTNIPASTLMNISLETGGSSFYWSHDSLIGLAAVFKQLFSSRVTSSFSSFEKIVSATELMANGANFTFILDDGIGKYTNISVLTGTRTNIEIFAKGPENYSDSIQTTYGSKLSLPIPGIAKTGTYQVEIKLGDMTRLEYYVDSYPVLRHSHVPVKLETRISSAVVDMTKDKLPAVFADVTRNGVPVAGARVTAIVEVGSERCNISLLDDGMDPDVMPDDGTYSANIFWDCLGDGRVNIMVYAVSTDSTFTSTSGLLLAPEMASDIKDKVGNKKVGPFQRTALLSGGLTIVNFQKPSNDVIPPGKISDVSVTSIVNTIKQSGETRNYTISWTATGDDISVGQAFAYEFRVSGDISLLLNNFTQADEISFHNNTVVPKHAGETEVITVTINGKESYTKTTFLAIVAVDEEGNRGEVSNIIPITVATQFEIVADETVYNTTEEPFVENTSKSVGYANDNRGLVITFVVGLAVAIVSSIAAIVWVYRTKCSVRNMQRPEVCI